MGPQCDGLIHAREAPRPWQHPRRTRRTTPEHRPTISSDSSSPTSKRPEFDIARTVPPPLQDARVAIVTTAGLRPRVEEAALHRTGTTGPRRIESGFYRDTATGRVLRKAQASSRDAGADELTWFLLLPASQAEEAPLASGAAMTSRPRTRRMGMGENGCIAPTVAATIEDARMIVSDLPRSYEALVRDQVKFRVGRIVYAAFSRDETVMGFAFPREERELLVASEPDKFLLPRPSEMRYQWVCVRLDAIDVVELRELLIDAWRMCVPKKVAAAYDG